MWFLFTYSAYCAYVLVYVCVCDVYGVWIPKLNQSWGKYTKFWGSLIYGHTTASNLLVLRARQSHHIQFPTHSKKHPKFGRKEKKRNNNKPSIPYDCTLKTIERCSLWLFILCVKEQNNHVFRKLPYFDVVFFLFVFYSPLLIGRVYDICDVYYGEFMCTHAILQH